MIFVLCSGRWFDGCLDELPVRRVGNHKHEAPAATAAAFNPAPWGEADRIIAVIVTQLPAQRPDAFELSREWGYVVDEDGRVRMRVTASMALSIAEQLAGWGSAVEVLEPENVKAHLVRLGAELVNLYAPASSQIPTAVGQCPR
ncbi:WYL domain-containing protein [Arthrobacter sp.]|uniref:WYL domain-containing protein n=1 Tax=Arthrobacter sp. TaxID=1667 RepID=UPI0026DF7EE3|nr:WYL domain-containing protein [Arthrobacter sp.]MDO5753387.1 WYL domain-containing protein [Arthrobacter sp.]